jgi:hypothetical protein
MSEATYTVTDDVYEELSDGNGRKRIFKAGQRIAWETAYAAGLVTTKHAPKAGETVTKIEPPKAEK